MRNIDSNGRLFVSLVVFLVSKVQRSYTKSHNITMIKRYNNYIKSIIDLWKNVLKSELPFNREGTRRRP